MPKYVQLQPGEPAPRFQQRNSSNPRYLFDVSAGRNLVLCFMGSSANKHARAAITAALKRRDLFNDEHAAFFGVTCDPADETEKRLESILPGYRFFFDADFKVCRLYGAWPYDEGDKGWVGKWVIIDPTLRIAAVISFREDGGDIAEAIDFVATLPPPGRIAGMDVQAPVIVMDRVFDPDFCRHLIGQYESHGGQLSGFMRDIDGKTHLITDPAHKRRRDHMLESPDDQKMVQTYINRRIIPEIEKVHAFRATRVERYLVACYDAEDQAHFRPHRDNTTRGTAHRRFAVSINLNDDFDGGEICFPEYGMRSFKPSAGSAVVFSCSLLHAVTQVTRGKRYAFLPFLYDDAAAAIRDENLKFVAGAGAQDEA